MSTTTRRTRALGLLAAATLILAAATPAAAGGHGQGWGAADRSYELTVLGTTDLHGNVFNWDYFKNAAYSDRSGNEVGIAKAATLIKDMRAERGASDTLPHSTPATPSRARRWPTTTPRSTRSPAARPAPHGRPR